MKRTKERIAFEKRFTGLVIKRFERIVANGGRVDTWGTSSAYNYKENGEWCLIGVLTLGHEGLSYSSAKTSEILYDQYPELSSLRELEIGFMSHFTFSDTTSLDRELGHRIRKICEKRGWL